MQYFIKQGRGLKWIVVFCLALYMAGCKNEDKKISKDPDSIYLDYKITGREAEDRLTVLLQFRAVDDEGDAMKIPAPGQVLLDEMALDADSAGLSGYFYEIHPAADSFEGSHRIRYTDANNRNFDEEFTWQPLKLLSAPADTVGGEDLVFEFSGLDSIDRLRILVTDTSFTNEGVNHVQQVRNNQLIFSADLLTELAPGPVQFEFIIDKSRRLENTPAPGGRLQVYYSISREFWLRK